MKKRNAKFNLDFLLDKPTSWYEEFHDRTKFKKLPPDRNPKFWPDEWKTVYYKGYPRLEEIVLPKPSLPGISLGKVLLNRISTRDFLKEPLSVLDISSLLYYSAGLKRRGKKFFERRFYPSPGGRYPLEVYLISLNTELPRGIYHYYLKKHSLEKISELESFSIRKYFNIKWLYDCGLIILITAVFKRNVVKYGERGYRHILAESGHMAQNLYLNTTALNLGCCAIGGYIDDKLNNLLDIDGINEAVVYVMGVGKPKKE